MRQIKLRAWDPINECIHPGFTIKEIVQLRMNPNSIEAIAFNYAWDQLEWLQFTGLLDKNGKEIYSGDILNVKTTFDNNMADRKLQPQTQVEVGFKDGCFIDTNTSSRLSDKIRIISSFKSEFTNYEIIGNIHENPELLK